MQLNLSNHTLEHSSAERHFDDPAGRAAELAAVMRLLPEDDRQIVDLVILQHRSHRDAAAAIGADAGAVTRRARRLRNRLACPNLRMIARALDTLDPATRRLAVDGFILAMPVNVLARVHGLNRRDAQSRLDFVRGWAKALHRVAIRAATVLNEDVVREDVLTPV